ncbi:hypothetical protein BT96DRAFT_980003 [Gymnopus androsaceus JB14]|uniref:Uncharacterized protein n=1 Tax=Gymnopus androsaceus JB14 TaxID=1447944 RepID=A0A6A4H178_9AGAR|nr:hypothetical protein BT96DRAFT_980003 [Gymnopus androsaceus JB14]
MFPSALSLICLCSYFPALLYALPSPQQSLTLEGFGTAQIGAATDGGIATDFLIQTGATGGAQTSFELVEVDTFAVGGQAVTTTVTAGVVASASGFNLEATIGNEQVTATLSESCQATALANAGGDCTVQLDGESVSVSGPGSAEVIAISATPTGSSSPSATSGSKKNSGLKHSSFDRKTYLSGVGLGAIVAGFVFGGI